MLILDCTGSMKKWINAAKNDITGIIENLTVAKAEMTVRVSIICYRDITD